MTYIVPNYFIDNNYSSLRKIDNILCLNNITKYKSDSVFARTTMHSMSILIDGSKVIHLNDKNININKGEISFLIQNNYYMSQRISNESNYKSMIVYFDDKFIFDFIKKYNILINTNKTKNIIKVSYIKNILFENNIKVFKEYLEQKLNDNLIKLKIEEIFLHALNQNSIEMYSFFNSILNTSQDRIKFILESNIDLIYSLDDICNITRLNPNQIRRYIKKEYNLVPKVWIDTQRLEKAILMLKNTNKTISEISSECGYSTVSWFIARFKKKYNLSPKQYRYKI